MLKSIHIDGNEGERKVKIPHIPTGDFLLRLSEVTAIMWLSLVGKVFLSMKNIADNSRLSIVTTVLTTGCRYCAEGNHHRCFHRYCW